MKVTPSRSSDSNDVILSRRNPQYTIRAQKTQAASQTEIADFGGMYHASGKDFSEAEAPLSREVGWAAGIKQPGRPRLFAVADLAQQYFAAGPGRWRYEPHPVELAIMPSTAAPLGMRRDGKTGLTAVATPYGAESHHGPYLSLFGREVKASKAAQARSGPVIAPEPSDQHAIEPYQVHLKQQKRQQSAEGH